MALRVGQWATGNVGKNALRTIIEHPDLELVGLIVSDPAKVGKDAAEICGLTTPTGIKASLDGDALIALKPDCISYCAVGTSGRNEVASGKRPGGAVEDMCRILAAGINVVSTSLIPMVHPPSANQDDLKRLQAACKEGNTSCFTSGFDPGFVHDMLPLLFTGVTRRIDSIVVSEIMSYGIWDKPDALIGKFGFGKPLDHVPPILKPGVLKIMWGSSVNLLAEYLGAELDRIEEHYELLPAPETFTIPAGTIEKGTSAGVRFQVRGFIGDRAPIIVQHVTRLRVQDAPQWPQASIGKAGCYRVEIKGDPDWTVDVGNPGFDDPTVPGTLAVALRCVNAIPAVVAAQSGVLTAFDLPHLIRRGLIKSA